MEGYFRSSFGGDGTITEGIERFRDPELRQLLWEMIQAGLGSFSSAPNRSPTGTFALRLRPIRTSCTSTIVPGFSIPKGVGSSGSSWREISCRLGKGAATLRCPPMLSFLAPNSTECGRCQFVCSHRRLD